ncbi:hypothetical protein EUBIFOR_02522 [Holdemanella biformis DSM 3989]|uniref:Uncharacterized protein n=1 Tax=Holdemanella biformis DSM 3989 TaxID=518637 RepID=B7CE78_9FIRM|nr:hypothetical protein EUBIFOR_02522 [Holdemanella biformis DSM 3989]
MDILTLLFFKLNAVVMPLFLFAKSARALMAKKCGRRVEEITFCLRCSWNKAVDWKRSHAL